MTIIEVTDNAIQKLLEKKSQDNFEYIRIGITGGGCAGFEYVFKDAILPTKEDRKALFSIPPTEKYVGSHIKSDLAGKKASNKSYEKYYKGMI